jgi:hypothetical protein
VFRPSDESWFIQLADFCAYAILCHEQPIPNRQKYGLHQSFEILEPILVRECAPQDPRGVIPVSR